MNTSCDVRRHKENLDSPRIDFAPDALPEVHSPSSGKNSNTGVSTSSGKRKGEIAQWYVLRTTYGREKKAYDYIIRHDGIAYLPMLKQASIVDGVTKTFFVPRIPNLFFAYGTETQIKSFVFDNVNLPFLRFYYSCHREGKRIVRTPLVVPQEQMDSLRIVCESEEDVLVVPPEVTKFKKGQLVKVIQGNFKGVVGHVSRYQGQQRVAIIIDNIITMATAYIPSAFLELLY